MNVWCESSHSIRMGRASLLYAFVVPMVPLVAAGGQC